MGRRDRGLPAAAAAELAHAPAEEGDGQAPEISKAKRRKWKGAPTADLAAAAGNGGGSADAANGISWLGPAAAPLHAHPSTMTEAAAPRHRPRAAAAAAPPEFDDGTAPTATAPAGGSAPGPHPHHRPPAPRPTAQFQYGNYSGYYGYRVGADFAEDPRLAHLRPDWFRGKRCLDIGCNEGLLTLAVAARCHPATVRGVDIDAGLIARARGHLHRLRQSAKRAAGDAAEADPAVAALAGVSFAVENYVASPLGLPPAHQGGPAPGRAPDAVIATSVAGPASVVVDPVYDTVLMLSVTKWVHLNFGDDGLKALFARAVASLSPGGLLLLEPQPWPSYAKAAKKRSTAADAVKRNYAGLMLRPDGFQRLLADDHGLVLESTATVPAAGAAASGFGERRLYLYRAPG